MKPQKISNGVSTVAGLVLFGLVIGLVVTEVGLRLAFPFRPGQANPWEPYVGWAGHPHQIRRPNSKYVETRALVYNQHGLRDKDYTYEKPDNVFRILILGDSFVEGEQTSLSNTFHKRLETLLNSDLNESSYEFEVLASGAWAWGTDQETLYFEHEGYRYQPDLTLLLFVFNDVCNNYAPCEARVQGQRSGEVLKPYFELIDDDLVLRNFPYDETPGKWKYENTVTGGLYRQFRVYQAVRDALGSLGFIQHEKPQRRLDDETEAHPGVYIYAAEDSEEYRLGWELTKRIIQRLRHQTDLHGSAFAIVSASSDIATYPEAWEAYTRIYPQLSHRAWNWQKPDIMLEQFSVEQGVDFVSLQPYFTAVASSETALLHIPIDQHWTEAGHELAAQAIFNYLRNSDVVGAELVNSR
jgi:hypothetical protein